MINASGKNARVQYGSFWKDVGASRYTSSIAKFRQLIAGISALLAMSVPGRPLISVHAHVKRAYEPAAKKGPWTREEDDDLRA